MAVAAGVVTLQGYSGSRWRPQESIITHPVRTLAGLVALLLTASGPATPPLPSSDYEADVVRRTDSERAARDLTSLVPDRCLAGFADQHARDMAQRGRLYHQDLGVVLTACRLQAVGENVAVGYVDGTAATQGWLRSPAHHANLLAPTHTHIGVGARRDAHGRWFVSQLLSAGAQDDQQGDEPLGRDLVPPLRGGP